MERLQTDVKFENGMSLAVELYPSDVPGVSPEIIVTLVDADGAVLQDIACVRKSRPTPDCEREDSVEVLVWTDSDDESWNARYEIPVS